MAERSEQTAQDRPRRSMMLRRAPSGRRFAGRALRFGAVCGLVVSAGAAAIAPAGAQSVDPPVPQPIIAEADGATLASMVNDYRVANGLNPLVIDASFSAATAPHALLLSSLNPAPEPPRGYAFWCPEATRSTFYHDNDANQKASAPAGSVSYGENIAYRCSPTFGLHASDIMTGWRNSPGHDQNMLNPNWTHIASVAVRWNNTTIAVHRFAKVPGTPRPDVRSAAATAPALTLAPTPTAVSAPVQPTPAPAAASTATSADANARPAADAAAAAPATAAPSTDDNSTNDNANPAPTEPVAATASAQTPQLAFTGSNLNLALLGLALIASGLGVLALPAVRRLDDKA